ncbi:hypothetical protein ZWY2020_035637 [Hordeum vulgare]|nr:hypothetical protein ZWY2020_035637 [Hordeum vulgare]
MGWRAASRTAVAGGEPARVPSRGVKPIPGRGAVADRRAFVAPGGRVATVTVQGRPPDRSGGGRRLLQLPTQVSLMTGPVLGGSRGGTAVPVIQPALLAKHVVFPVLRHGADQRSRGRQGEERRLERSNPGQSRS